MKKMATIFLCVVLCFSQVQSMMGSSTSNKKLVDHLHGGLENYLQNEFLKNFNRLFDWKLKGKRCKLSRMYKLVQDLDNALAYGEKVEHFLFEHCLNKIKKNLGISDGEKSPAGEENYYEFFSEQMKSEKLRSELSLNGEAIASFLKILRGMAEKTSPRRAEPFLKRLQESLRKLLQRINEGDHYWEMIL